MTKSRPSLSETDILALQGKDETIRLEFKAGKLLDGDRNKWIEAVSKSVSAFANTEGGTLLIGVPEQRQQKRRVAGIPDGIDDTQIAIDDVQRTIEGNVSPYLSGLRVYRVPLSSTPGRSVVVIDVPQGPTAYQAADRKYYGRSEFEAKALPDHEIRLRMSRGKVARAEVHLRARHGSLAHPPLQLEDLPPRSPDSPPLRPFQMEALLQEQPYDEVLFAGTLKNVGEVTIRDPVVDLSVEVSIDPRGAAAVPIVSGFAERHTMRGVVLYPDDHVDLRFDETVPTSPAVRCIPRATLALGSCMVRWTVYMDNAAPSRGELDAGAVANDILDRLRGGRGAERVGDH